MTAFPWSEAMRAGLGVLRLPPDAFWRMTPRELAAALGGLTAVGPDRPNRTTLDEMMSRFPDTDKNHA